MASYVRIDSVSSKKIKSYFTFGFKSKSLRSNSLKYKLKKFGKKLDKCWRTDLCIFGTRKNKHFSVKYLWGKKLLILGKRNHLCVPVDVGLGREQIDSGGQTIWKYLTAPSYIEQLQLIECVLDSMGSFCPNYRLDNFMRSWKWWDIS